MSKYNFDLFGGMAALGVDLTGQEQIDHIREFYRYKTGRKLRLRDAVEVLDRINTGCRDAVRNRPQTGLNLVCPWCFACEQDLMIDPNSLSHVRCFRCNDEFTPQQAHDEIASQLAPWQAYMRLVARTASKPSEPLPELIAARVGSGALCECGS